MSSVSPTPESAAFSPLTTTKSIFLSFILIVGFLKPLTVQKFQQHPLKKEFSFNYRYIYLLQYNLVFDHIY